MRSHKEAWTSVRRHLSPSTWARRTGSTKIRLRCSTPLVEGLEDRKLLTSSGWSFAYQYDGRIEGPMDGTWLTGGLPPYDVYGYGDPIDFPDFYTRTFKEFSIGESQGTLTNARFTFQTIPFHGVSDNRWGWANSDKASKSVPYSINIIAYKGDGKADQSDYYTNGTNLGTISGTATEAEYNSDGIIKYQIDLTSRLQSFIKQSGAQYVGIRLEMNDDFLDVANFDVNLDYNVVRSSSDIAAISLNRSQDGGVEIAYGVSGTPLKTATAVTLYWATGSTFDTTTGGPIYSGSVQQPGSYGPIHISADRLSNPPAGATQLLLVADPTSPDKPSGNVIETDETNNILSIPWSAKSADIEIKPDTVKMVGPTTIQFTYQTKDVTTGFKVGIYRSAYPEFNLSDLNYSGDPNQTVAIFLGLQYFDPSEAVTTATIDVGDRDKLGIDPNRPYVFVVADPDNSVNESNESNNSAKFQKHVVAVVTHGYVLPFFASNPAWTGVIAGALRDRGYESVTTYDWSKTSGEKDPQAIARATRGLVAQLQLANYPANDVVDVHLIGHSRGTIVVTQAMGILIAEISTPQTQFGYKKLTLLDPHPANPRSEGYYSLNPKWSRSAGVMYSEYDKFRKTVQDPNIIIPSGVDEAEVFFQRTTAQDASVVLNALSEDRNLVPSDSVINLWGVGPEGIVSYAAKTRFKNVTFTTDSNGQKRPTGISHTSIHGYYRDFLRGNDWVKDA